MKRAVWVTAIAPCFDAGGGGGIRQAHLIDGLADRFEVDLLLAGTLEDERVRARVQAVEEVPAEASSDPARPTLRRMRDIRWQLVDRQPDEVARQRPIRRAFARHLRAADEHDLVCVEYIGLAPILPERRSAFWTLTLHNLISGMARHSAAIAPGRRQRLMRTIEERNARRVERWASTAYDLVVTPSVEDAALLSPDAVVVPNGVDVGRFQPSSVPSAPRVVFTGALHTLPNRDGIRWFCERAWPLVRRQLPDASLEIVGSRPPAEVLALAEAEGVEVHADVPDVAPFLERARVAVVPIRIGTGSRLKALEAMATGRPVVGTAIGMGGLDVLPGQDVLIEDEPQEFANAVLRCLTDSELAAGLGARGRGVVEDRYSWSRIAANYAALLDERASLRSSERDASTFARA